MKAETKIFFNDTLDHTLRLIELVETQRDMLTGLIEMHLSLSQARTNDVISYLTIVSVIFMPLTFLVGVWGMNFDPESLAMEHAGAEGLLRLSLVAAVHGCCRGRLDCLLQMEEMALTAIRFCHLRLKSRLRELGWCFPGNCTICAAA